VEIETNNNREQDTCEVLYVRLGSFGVGEISCRESGG